MKRVTVLLLLAVLGIGLALVAVFRSNRPIPPTTPVVQPPQTPFPYAVAGAGIIEASTGNIAVGTPVSGIIMEIYVKVRDHVKVGDPLFKVDDRELQAQRLTAAAGIKEAEAVLAKSRHRLEFIEELSRRDKSAVSAQQLSELHDEVEVGRTALASSKAQAEQVDAEIARRTVRAPVAGVILQIHSRLGEYAQAGVPDSPLMILGGDNRLYVRVDIDENEAWRVRPEANAVAFLRSNPDIKMSLRFEYLEPYVVPKTALTGRSTERTDTRVLQVLYSFDKDVLPVYVGEQVDVFIEAKPSMKPSTERTP